MRVGDDSRYRYHPEQTEPAEYSLSAALADGSVVVSFYNEFKGHKRIAKRSVHVVAWSILGALICGTTGTSVGKHVPSDLMEIGPGIVFALVGVLVLGVELLA